MPASKKYCLIQVDTTPLAPTPTYVWQQLNYGDHAPVTYTATTSSPSAADMSVLLKSTDVLPQVGQAIKLYLRDDTLVFAGTISEVDWAGRFEGQAASPYAFLEVPIKAVGFDDRLYHRTTFNRLTGRCAQYRSFLGNVNTNDISGVGHVYYTDGNRFSQDLIGKTVQVNGANVVIASVISPLEMTIVGAFGATLTHVAFQFIVYYGDVVKDLIDTYLEFEGFTYTGGSIQSGSALDTAGIIFDPPVTVIEAINSALQNNNDSSYYFSTDVNQVCSFLPRTAIAAPFNFTTTSGKQKRAVSIRETREDVRNTEISTCNWTYIVPSMAQITGDGATRAWFITNRISQIISVLLNGVPVSIADGSNISTAGSGTCNTVNSGANTDITAVTGFYNSGMVGTSITIDGNLVLVLVFTDATHITVSTNLGTLSGVTWVAGTVATEDYFYQPYDNGFWQNPANPVLTGADVLIITYRAVADNLIEYTDDAARMARGRIEGGFGRYEQAIDRTDLYGKVSVLLQSTDSVTRLETNYQEVTLSTFEPGLQIGTVITLDIPDEQINNQVMFIDEIQATDASKWSPYDFEYTVKCISTTRRISDAQVLRQAFSTNTAAAGGGGGGSTGGGIVIVGGGGGIAAFSLNLNFTTAFVIMSPGTPTVGALLTVYGLMDGTGHAVTWDSIFQWPPVIDTTPNVAFSALFQGNGSKWVIVHATVGRHP